MALIAAAILFALFLWWFSTGAILMLVRLPRAAYPYAMITAVMIAVMALAGMAATRNGDTVVGAFAGFTYGLIVWAALEMAFLFGYITGPRITACPPGLTGWPRFRAAFEAIAWHELSILAAMIGMIALSWGAENRIATDTFLVLFAMRISAKLNVFLGAPNVSVEFLPEHLRYLGSYFQRGKVSGFFPLSVTTASLAFGFVVHAGIMAETTHATVALTLIATLLALAIIEHWFLVLPVQDAALWRWALGKKPIAPPILVLQPSLVAQSSLAAIRSTTGATLLPVEPFDVADRPLIKQT